MPQPLAEDERVAAENDGDMMIPAAEGTSFVVIQPEFALEVLVHALGAPAFFRDPYELLSARRLAHPRERVVRRGLLPVGPLDQEPVKAAVGVARVHLEHREPRAHRTATALLPRGRTECTPWELL